VSQPQPYRQTDNCHESSSSIFPSASDEGDASKSRPDEHTQQPETLKSTCPYCHQTSVANTYIGHPKGKEDNEASHKNENDGSSLLSVFLSYFAEIITLLVVVTNHDYTDRLDNGHFPTPDVIEGKIFVFLALTT
jgi:hypothetical protein